MWGTIGDDFIRMVIDFSENRVLPKVVNTTWVTLIPKIECAIELKDFMPISMVGCIYKIIAKILALRLRKVMPNFIWETQYAFVMERQILDGAL